MIPRRRVLLLGLVSPIAHGSPDRMALDMAVESSEFMRRSAYRAVASLSRDDAPSGAYGPVNRAWEQGGRVGRWYIEEQRHGADLVVGGVVQHDERAIERGLGILRWGFAQQRPDGGFACPDAFHSASFFVEAVAHALLVMAASTQADRHRPAIDAMKAPLHAAARWMVSPAVEPDGRRRNEPFTHRRHLVGAALGEAGVLLADDELVSRSVVYIRDGLALQHPLGFNPERGGPDSSYHAIGLLYALRHLAIVDDAGLRQPLTAMLQRGVAWLATRVAADGSVSTAGNTRVGDGARETGRSGQPKRVAVGAVSRALHYWSVVSGEARYGDLARRVAMQAGQWR